MKIEQMADFLEECNEHLEMAVFGYSLHKGEVPKEVEEFVNWCIEENKKAIDTPRRRDGKSYRQWRDESNKV
jgi:hypothetical protein